MPPLNQYVFKCISDAQIIVTISTYGSVEDAHQRLMHHVADVNNWKLDNQN